MDAGSVDNDVAVFLAGYNQDWTQVIFVAGLKPPRDGVPKNGRAQLERAYYIRKDALNTVEHVVIRLIVRPKRDSDVSNTLSSERQP